MLSVISQSLDVNVLSECMVLWIKTDTNLMSLECEIVLWVFHE